VRQEDGFGGTQVSASTFGAVTFSETRYRPGTRLPRHVHPAAYFCVVRSGGFREDWGSGSSAHGPGDVIFHAAGDEHADVFLDGGARCFNVVLGPALLDGVRVRGRRQVLTQPPIRRVFLALQRELRLAAPSPRIVEGLVHQALGEAFERNAGDRRRAPWLDHVHELVRTRFDHSLTVAGLAEEVGVHPVHLSRAFHKRFGVPLAAHVRALRVDGARRLLRDSTLTLSDVATAAGFADQSHLTRVFKRATGLTPARYRRRRG
jgi:AraC family transcriptional regulator